MRVVVLDENYGIAEKLSAKPVCGDDFCDDCGECLGCGIEECRGDGYPHLRVVHFDEIPEWKAQHPEAEPRA